jgi:hypothetical protein
LGALRRPRIPSQYTTHCADKKQNGDLPMVGLCGFPPIEQETLDGWGTVSSRRGFHLSRVSSPVGRKLPCRT